MPHASAQRSCAPDLQWGHLAGRPAAVAAFAATAGWFACGCPIPVRAGDNTTMDDVPTLPGGHVVLPAVDGQSYASLRRRPTPRAERYRLGRQIRREVPRSALGTWTPWPGRPDVVQQVRAAHQGRLDSLIPVRVGRMVASPYGFLRGTAVVMAEDVARPPGHRHHAGDLRRRPPGQLRLLRLARSATSSSTSTTSTRRTRAAGSGTCAGWWRASGWPAGRTRRPRTSAQTRSRRCVAAYRERGALPRRAAAAGARLQPAGRRPAARDRHREVAAAGDRAGRQAAPGPGPATGRCPGSPSSTRAGGGSSRSRR